MARYVDLDVGPKIPVIFVAFNGSAPVYIEVLDILNGNHRATYTFQNPDGEAWSGVSAYDYDWTGPNHRRVLRIQAWSRGVPIDVDRRNPYSASIGRRDVSDWPGTGAAPNPWHGILSIETIDG
jgi:hypothetical protein